jgi:hypothetical protein
MNVDRSSRLLGLLDRLVESQFALVVVTVGEQDHGTAADLLVELQGGEGDGIEHGGGATGL